MLLKISERKKAENETLQLEKTLREQLIKYFDDYDQNTLAVELGISDSWVSQVMKPGSPNYLKFQIIQIPLLRRIIGDSFFLQLAQDMDYFSFPFPLVNEFMSGDFTEFSKVLKQFSRYMEEVAKAFQEGRITSKESEKVWISGSEAITHIFAFMKSVRIKAEAEVNKN